MDCHTSDEYWFTSETFLSPTQLQLGDARLGPVGIAQVKALKALPAQFDSSDLVEQQYEAVLMRLYEQNNNYDFDFHTALVGENVCVTITWGDPWALDDEEGSVSGESASSGEENEWVKGETEEVALVR